jgi:hypothetical protein
MYGL